MLDSAIVGGSFADLTAARILGRAQPDGDGITLPCSNGQTERFGALCPDPVTARAGSPAEQLGRALSEGPMGPFVAVGPMSQTSVPGVFAAGDRAQPAPNITVPRTDGAQAATGCHASLLFPDFVQPIEVSP